MEIEQFKEVTEWQRETFGEATALSKMAHLHKEVIELIEALGDNDPERRLEFADIIILIYGAAESDGMTYEDVCNAVAEKMDINRARKWGEPDEEGVVQHIKG